MSFEFVRVPEGSDQWYAARREGVSASEIAAVLGISPWASAFTLYHRKKRLLDEQPDNEAMYWGRRLEALVLDRFADEHPDIAVGRGGLYRSRDRPWQMATPDAIAYEGRRAWPSPPYAHPVKSPPIAVVQAKTAAGPYGEWGEPGTDQIPVHYRAQCLWEMDVLNVGTGFVPVLFGGRDYREYQITYDVRDVDIMRRRAAQFLERLADDRPPPVDGTPGTTETLEALHPAIAEREAQVPADAVAAYRVWRDLAKRAERHKSLAGNRIRLALGDAGRGLVGDEHAVTRSPSGRTSLDIKALYREQPEIYQKYATETTVNSLRVKEKP